MAGKNGRGQLQHFVKDQLDEAQKRFAAFEGEAERLLKDLLGRAKSQRKELQQLANQLRKGDLFENPTVKRLGRRANEASTDLKKRLEGLQSRVIQATGVATQGQFKTLNREVSKLARKVDSLLGRRQAAQ